MRTASIFLRAGTIRLSLPAVKRLARYFTGILAFSRLSYTSKSKSVSGRSSRTRPSLPWLALKAFSKVDTTGERGGT